MSDGSNEVGLLELRRRETESAVMFQMQTCQVLFQRMSSYGLEKWTSTDAQDDKEGS